MPPPCHAVTYMTYHCARMRSAGAHHFPPPSFDSISLHFTQNLFRERQLLIMPALTAPEASQDPAEAAGGADDKKPGDGAPSVRFSSAIEEIAPTRSPLSPDAARGSDGVQDAPELSSQQLKEFSQSLQGRQLQEHRMAAFQFEAFSLPPSRVRRNLAPSDPNFAAMNPLQCDSPSLRRYYSS